MVTHHPSHARRPFVVDQPGLHRPAAVDSCVIVIFGASGDLTARKLIPALYHLFLGKQLPSPVRIIGFARREKNDQQWH